MHKRFGSDATVAVLAWLLFIFFIAATNPASMPVGFMVLPFGLLLAALLLTWTVLWKRLFKGLRPYPARLTKSIGQLACIILVVCLAMQSIGQLSIRDFIVVVALSMVGLFYVSRSLSSTD